MSEKTKMLGEVLLSGDEGELHDRWLDRQFENLGMAYCVDCKCFVDPLSEDLPQNGMPRTHEHTGHKLAFTSGEKASEEVIARLQE